VPKLTVLTCPCDLCLQELTAWLALLMMFRLQPRLRGVVKHPRNMIRATACTKVRGVSA